MRERSRPSAARASGAAAVASLDLVCCAAAGRHLAVLVQSGARASATMLPWTALDPTAAIDTAGVAAGAPGELR